MSARQQVHKTLRGSRYYFRIAIPLKLQPVLGCKELKKSLTTSNPKHATRLCRILSNGMERFFMTVAEAQPRQADYQTMMQQYFEKTLREAYEEHNHIEGMFYGSEPAEPTDDPYQFAAVAYKKLTALKAYAQSYRHTDQQEQEAEIMLRNAGFSSLPHSGLLADHLMTAAIEAQRIELAYHQKDFGNIATQHPQLRNCLNYFEGQSFDSVSLKECTERYLEHKKPTVKLKTFKLITPVMQRLQDVLGADRAIHSIRKQPDGVYLERMVKKIPINFTRDFAGQNLKELLQENHDYPVMEDGTLETYWGYFQEFFNWAVDRGYLPENPINNIKLSKSNKAKAPRTCFSDQQLETLFLSPIYTGRKNEKRALWEKGNLVIKDGNYWLPLVAAFTGMREGEILQITPNVLKEKDGIHYFDLSPENGVKDIKTYNGIRLVPIHPELIKMGFLEYFEKRRKKVKADGRIFEDGVTIPDTQDRTKNYSRGFSEYTVKIGLRQNKDGREVFHSFRHNVQTALSEADVKNVIACWILGHQPPKETQTVGDMVYTHSRPDLKKLYKAICKVKYNIDFSHLYMK